MLILTSLFLAIGAFNGQNNLLFFTFGLSVFGILLSGIVGGSSMMGIRVHRVSARPVTVGGDPGPIRYIVENRNRYLPAFAILIEEFVTPDESIQAGSADWTPALVPALSAGKTQRVHASIRGTQSGILRLRGLRIRSSMPFGLIEKCIEFELPGQIEIHPAVLPVQRESTSAKNSQRTPATIPSNRLGGEDEFMGVREYVPGDSTRKIAWARSASHETLVVRINAIPRTDSVWIEVSPKAANRNELELILAATASHASELIQQGIAVGLEVEPWGISLRPRCGRGQFALIQSALACKKGACQRKSRTLSSNRLHISAGPIKLDASKRCIVASSPETWLAPRGELPDAMSGKNKTPVSGWRRLLRNTKAPIPRAIR